ncbi:phage tail protein [Trueperella pyogenes]|uniref:phage tail protein n=1 Tax=Trueperella pyogenes TaxID=1661 RepID=UPI00345C6F8C
MANQKVIVSVLADTRKFHSAMREAGKSSGLTQLASGAKKLAAALAAAAAGASVAAIAIGRKAVSAASDLEQSAGAIDDVFKQAAKQMHNLADAAATSVGLSKNSYNELALVLGTQLKNGGTSIDKLAGKTNELITLGADLAAGFGGSTVDAVQAISSALKGERDPIEKYGVSLKQAAIDAKAAELGFTKVGGALSQEASNAATLALIMEQTSDMHGKFGREGDTLAQKLQILKAKLENAAATIGTYLLPIVTKAVDAFTTLLGPALERLKGWIENTALPALQALSGFIKDKALPVLQRFASEFAEKVIPALQDAATWITGTVIPAVSTMAQKLWENRDSIIPIAAAIGAAVVAFTTIARVMATTRAIMTAFTTAQTLLNAAMRANPIGLIMAAIAALVTGLIVAYRQHEGFRTAVNNVWTNVMTVVNGVVAWFKTYVWPTLSAVFSAVVAAVTLVKDGFIVAWNLISSAVSIAVAAISAVLTPLIAVISAAFSVVSALVSGVWSVAWTLFSSVVTGAWAIVSSIIGGISRFIGGIFGAVSALINGNWSGAWTKFTTTISTAWNDARRAVSDGIGRVTSLVSELPGKVVSAIGNVGSTLWNAGSEIIGGFIRGITSGFSKVKEKLGQLTSWLPSWKGPKPLDKVLLMENGRLVIGGFIRGLESKYGAVRESLGGLTGALPSMVTPGGRLQLTGSPAAAAAARYEIHVHQLHTTPETGRIIVNAIREYEETSGRRLS